MSILSRFPVIQAQSARLKTQLTELDRRLALRYGDRYYKVKQQLYDTKVWYEKTRAEAQSSGTIPLDRKQEETTRQVGDAGSAAARKEAVIKQQIQELWQSIKTRKSS